MEPDHIPSDTAMAVAQLTWAQHGWYSILWRSRQGRVDRTKCPPFKWKVGVARHAFAEESFAIKCRWLAKLGSVASASSGTRFGPLNF